MTNMQISMSDFLKKKFELHFDQFLFHSSHLDSVACSKDVHNSERLITGPTRVSPRILVWCNGGQGCSTFFFRVLFRALYQKKKVNKRKNYKGEKYRDGRIWAISFFSRADPPGEPLRPQHIKVSGQFSTIKNCTWKWYIILTSCMQQESKFLVVVSPCARSTRVSTCARITDADTSNYIALLLLTRSFALNAAGCSKLSLICNITVELPLTRHRRYCNCRLIAMYGRSKIFESDVSFLFIFFLTRILCNYACTFF